MSIIENKYFPVGITGLSFVTAIAAFQYLPERMATHWGTFGEVNGYMAKFWGLAVMPIVSLFMLALFYIIPKIDPKKENLKQFESYFRRFISVMFGFLYYIFLLTIFWNLGYRFNMVQWMSPAFAILMWSIGTMIENSKPNWFIGIRTPWTLSSPRVWEKTHKIGAKLIKIAGILSLLGIILPQMAIWFILVPMLFFAVFSIGYSYWEYQKSPPSPVKSPL